MTIKCCITLALCTLISVGCTKLQCHCYFEVFKLLNSSTMENRQTVATFPLSEMPFSSCLEESQYECVSHCYDRKIEKYTSHDGNINRLLSRKHFRVFESNDKAKGNLICQILANRQIVDVKNLDEGLFYKIKGCNQQDSIYVRKMFNMNMKLSCDQNGNFYVPATDRKNINKRSPRVACSRCYCQCHAEWYKLSNSIKIEERHTVSRNLVDDDDDPCFKSTDESCYEFCYKMIDRIKVWIKSTSDEPVTSFYHFDNTTGRSLGDTECMVLKGKQIVDVQNLSAGLFYTHKRCDEKNISYIGDVFDRMDEKLSCDKNGKFYVPGTGGKNRIGHSSKSVSLGQQNTEIILICMLSLIKFCKSL